MKRIGALFLGGLGVIANVITLISFFFSNNWQTPTQMGSQKLVWGALTALLAFYTISVISAIIIQYKRNKNVERKKTQHSLFDFVETKTEDGMEFWVHMPFSIFVFVLWVLAFGDFSSFGNSTEAIGVIIIIILMLAMLFTIAVLFPLVALTNLMLRLIYE